LILLVRISDVEEIIKLLHVELSTDLGLLHARVIIAAVTDSECAQLECSSTGRKTKVFLLFLFVIQEVSVFQSG
jgi:hypothetical protein